MLRWVTKPSGATIWHSVSCCPIWKPAGINPSLIAGCAAGFEKCGGMASHFLQWVMAYQPCTFINPGQDGQSHTLGSFLMCGAGLKFRVELRHLLWGWCEVWQPTNSTVAIWRCAASFCSRFTVCCELEKRFTWLQVILFWGLRMGWCLLKIQKVESVIRLTKLLASLMP